MDFFESQDDARKKTKKLVVLFAMAVIAIICAIYAVLWPAFSYSHSKANRLSNTRPDYSVYPEEVRIDLERRDGASQVKARKGFFQLDWFLMVAAGVSGVILLGSGFKTLQLSSGGGAVARDLGGRRIDPNTGDADERKLMNVVEEMAIASGVPVPEVYVMEQEPGINAFAAGKTYSDAAVGVSRGAMKLLNRDELQGVIAHEFSHVLNGDMKLNLRLIGVLHGILILAILGRIILRSAAYSGGRSRDDRGAGVAFMVLGIALLVVGYIGVFFGHLIKSAISRQREYLADASAVQFTRNPDGIAGALKKIGGLSYGSQLVSGRAEEVSHMTFGNALPPAYLNSLATHPPLPKRIAAIDKSWDGKFIKPKIAEVSSSMTDADETAAAAAKQDSILQIPGMEAHGPMVGAIAAAAAMADEVGQVRPEGVRHAQQIRGGLPPEWLSAAHNISGAQALIFSMLLAQDDDTRADEFVMLRTTTDELTFKMVTEWQQGISALQSPQKIALIDLSIPALKRLNKEEYDRFLDIMEKLIQSDGQIDLFEFMLAKIVHRHLDLFFVRRPEPKVRYRELSQLEDEAAVLLSTLANLGEAEAGEDAVNEAFSAGAREVEMEIGGNLDMAGPEKCGMGQIDAALNKFDEAAPMVKRTLLNACGKAVMADGKVISDEAELLRAIADTIGCPVPPFVREEEAA